MTSVHDQHGIEDNMRAYRQTASVVSISILLILTACGVQPSTRAPSTQDTASRVANLHAFARLYGLVRWFHPSDAAAVVDWDRFAIDGAHRVVDAPNVRELQVRLTDLFAPIAPTMDIVGPGERFPGTPKSLPRSVAGLDLVAWQHKGYGDTTYPTAYVSKRTHRNTTTRVPGALFAALSQSIDATPLRGAKIRFRGTLRTLGHARGQLWLRVDRGDDTGFFDNMTNNPVRSDSWTPAEIVGTVATDATRVVFGTLNNSQGTVWYDDLEFAVATTNGTWTSIPIANGGFEEPHLAGWQSGIRGSTASHAAGPPSIDGWHVLVDQGSFASGRASLRVEPATRTITEELFEHMPSPNETFDTELGSGLRVRVPLALYSRANRTLGDDPSAVHEAETAQHRRQQVGFDAIAGAADVIVFWNVFQHFWPYWNTVATDWNAMLDVALAAALADRGVDDHLTTLEHLSVGAPDGHVSLHCPGESEPAYLPFAVDFIESQLVVTASTDPAIKRGDVIVAVDGQPAGRLLAAEQALVSGSPQWRMIVALTRFGRGSLHSNIQVRVHRGDREFGEVVQRFDQPVTEAPIHPPIYRFDDGVYYVDLSRTGMDDIERVMDQLAAAPGVVFDLRHYPRRNHDVFSHVITRRDIPTGWELVPLITRPDSGSAPAAWEDTSTWNMPRLAVREPHIAGRVAVMTGPDAISYAEAVMALVEYYHLGEIVGAATAGTNGDVAEVTLPTGCATRFTGRRVTRADGTPDHLIGIQPTIPASRTLSGVAAGRDEVLERALAYVRTGSR